jgi:hypothetical protein
MDWLEYVVAQPETDVAVFLIGFVSAVLVGALLSLVVNR